MMLSESQIVERLHGQGLSLGLWAMIEVEGAQRVRGLTGFWSLHYVNRISMGETELKREFIEHVDCRWRYGRLFHLEYRIGEVLEDMLLVVIGYGNNMHLRAERTIIGNQEPLMIVSGQQSNGMNLNVLRDRDQFQIAWFNVKAHNMMMGIVLAPKEEIVIETLDVLEIEIDTQFGMDELWEWLD